MRPSQVATVFVSTWVLVSACGSSASTGAQENAGAQDAGGEIPDTGGLTGSGGTTGSVGTGGVSGSAGISGAGGGTATGGNTGTGGATDAGTPKSVSYELRFIPGSAYNIYVRVGGGAPHAVQVDTGSDGLYFPANLVGPDANVTTETCSITYVSSGNTLSGHRAYAKVQFVGSQKTGDSGAAQPITAQMPFCAVDNFNGGMMGVGFGRGIKGVDINAALQIQEIKDGTMRAGYILSTQPALRIVLGITADNSSGFKKLKLTADAKNPGEWVSSSLRGCLSIPSKPAYGAPCGPLLVDTGISDCLLWGPADPTLGGLLQNGATTVAPGVQMSIFTEQDASILDYSFVTGQVDAPQNVTVRTASGFSINTGRRSLLDYDYLFDSQSGEVGFRKASP